MPYSPSVLLLLFLAGLAAGFIDAIAGGGGLISVPSLLWAGLPPQLALGTNKLQSSCGTTLAVWRYARAGLVSWREVRLAAGITFLAALLGAWVLTRVSNEALKHLVPWLLLTIALYTLLSPNFGLKRSAPKLSPATFACLISPLLGFYDGFFGPGTGSFWTIALLTLLGSELTRATAFTKVVNLASNLASLLIFACKGLLVIPVAGAMIGGQLIGARLGSGLVIKHGARLVRIVFLCVVFAMILKLLWDQWHARG